MTPDGESAPEQPDHAREQKPDKTPVATVDDMLANVLGQFMGGAMCTGWVLISEWMDSNGDYWVHTATDERKPPWQHLGLLTYVLDEGAYDLTIYEGDEDGDDEG